MNDIKKLLKDKTFYTDDPVQRRYEMLRAWRISGLTQKEAAKAFNYSSQNLKKVWTKYKQKGILGLIDLKKGPKSRRDKTKNAEPRIIELRTKDDMSINEIEEKLTKEKMGVSYGTVNRVLKDHNLPKKKRRSGR